MGRTIVPTKEAEALYDHAVEILEKADQIREVVGQFTHRFVKGDWGWYLHSTVDLPKKPHKTFQPREIGCIGVDVNALLAPLRIE